MLVSELKLYYLIQLTAHLVKKNADAALSDVSEITTAQAAVLNLVNARGPVTQRALARELRLNESAITAMANRLLKLELIRRERSTEDGRAWQLTITEDGLAALANIRQPFAEINAMLADALPDDEARRVAEGLAKVIDRFDGNS